MEELNTQQENTTVYVNRQMQPEINVVGIVGFVMSLVAVLIGWIPILGWIFGGFLWLAGLVLSIIGIFKEPKTFAIAGLVISIVSFLILALIIWGIFGLFGYFKFHLPILGLSV